MNLDGVPRITPEIETIYVGCAAAVCRRYGDGPIRCTAERTRNPVNSAGWLRCGRCHAPNSTKFRLIARNILRITSTGEFARAAVPRAIVRPPVRSSADAAVNCTCDRRALSIPCNVNTGSKRSAASALRTRHRALALFADCTAFFSARSEHRAAQ